jgi:hypothetical protein
MTTAFGRLRAAVVALVLAAIVVGACVVAAAPPPRTVNVDVRNGTQYRLLRSASSGSGAQLYQIIVGAASPATPERRPDYVDAPYLLSLRGNRTQIGYDYADLLAEQTTFTFNTFIQHVTGHDTKAIAKLSTFLRFMWNDLYRPNIPQRFLDEFAGMRAWQAANPRRSGALSPKPADVAEMFLALANLPADGPNILSALERSFEHGLPKWLREIINDIIAILEKIIKGCDAFGVFGQRTLGGVLYTSRNLDFNRNTGIDKYKLITVYNVTGAPHRYATIGFAFGLGALAGMSRAGVTTSEMNLDNSRVTIAAANGLPFPMRLRDVLENAHDLQSAMRVWNATNNTNSFNFLIGSAADGAAYALETEYRFTAQFPANSPIERASFYDCGQPPHVDPTCAKWAPPGSTGKVRIGFPVRDAVWRTNHGLNPTIMATQEPLFNDTVFRYNLLHSLFVGYENANQLIGDADAVAIVATLGIKGENFLTCNQPLRGDNIMSIAYRPGAQRMYVAWERGSGTGAGGQWRPAACAPYVRLDMQRWWG